MLPVGRSWMGAAWAIYTHLKTRKVAMKAPRRSTKQVPHLHNRTGTLRKVVQGVLTLNWERLILKMTIICTKCPFSRASRVSPPSQRLGKACRALPHQVRSASLAVLCVNWVPIVALTTSPVKNALVDMMSQTWQQDGKEYTRTTFKKIKEAVAPAPKTATGRKSRSSFSTSSKIGGPLLRSWGKIVAPKTATKSAT